MRRFFGLVAVLLLSARPASAQRPLTAAESRALPSTATPPALPGYVLAWHDEFNVDGPPDTAHWIPEIGFVRNRELQWYQPQNATVKDGVLILDQVLRRIVVNLVL